jgi:chaperone modulatory protein CbpM
MTNIIIEQHTVSYSIDDLCHYCTIDIHSIEEFVELGVIEPDDMNAPKWQFSMADYIRLRKALRLGQDLDINPPGAALVLELIDEIDRLQQQLASRGDNSQTQQTSHE